MPEPRDITPDSRATAVTFFEDRAEVTREATLHLDAPGLYRVQIEGVTPFIDDRSLQAHTAGADLLNAQVHRRLVRAATLDQDALRALEREVRDLLDHEYACDADRSRAQRQRQRLHDLLQRWGDGLTRAPDDLLDDPAPWTEALQALEDDLQASADAEAQANADLRDAQRQTAFARLRLAQGQATTQRVTTTVELQLRAQAPGTCTLRLTYRTPCALWRPEHAMRLRMSDDGAPHRVELTTRAVIWQRTGERWDAVQVRCSTARPAANASPPPLQEDRLHLRRKSPEEQRTIHVETREEHITAADDRPAASELPGVDDGGEPQVFTAAIAAHLPSSGEPCRVDLYHLTLDAEVQRLLLPERTPVAHLRATATLPRSAPPLLAGPVQLARQDTFVGRARQRFVASGDRLEVGFGADDAVRVRRRVIEDADSTVMGTQLRERRVELSLSNLSDTPRALHLIERIPVSELDDITIHLERAPGWTFDAPRGFLTRDLTLPPNATERLDFTYRIKAASNVALPF